MITQSRSRVIFAVVIAAVLCLALQFGLNVHGAPLETRTALTVTNISTAGVTDTLAAANADGNRFYNDGRVFLEVANGSGTTCTVTIVTPLTFMGLALADTTVDVPDGSTYFIGPFRTTLYNNTSGSDKGYTYVNYSGVTTVTVGAWRLP